MEYRTLLLLAGHRHGGVKTRWNIDMMEKIYDEHRTLLSAVEHRHGGVKTRWNIDKVE